MNNAQLKKKLLGTPYFLWSLIFILIPLGMVFYYGLTDRSGAFTLNNIISITTHHMNGAIRSIMTFVSIQAL